LDFKFDLKSLRKKVKERIIDRLADKALKREEFPF